MRLSPTAYRQKTPTRDPRTIPLPLAVDDAGLAVQVQSARTPEEAWRALGLPGEHPGDVAALTEAITALCAISDAIAKGLVAFGALDHDEDAPATWVDRMVELHLDELAGYWALDEVAYRSVREGGWTATTPEALADTEAGRVAQRARWCAEAVKPTAPALWFDRTDRLLSTEAVAGDVEGARRAGRMLVQGAAHWRFTNWRKTRTEAGNG